MRQRSSKKKTQNSTPRTLLGSLSNNYGDGDGDGYGYENVTQEKNSRCLKLYRAYFRAVSKLRNRKRKMLSCTVFPSATEREIRHFHVVVVQRRLRNVQKKRVARAKLLFC